MPLIYLIYRLHFLHHTVHNTSIEKVLLFNDLISKRKVFSTFSMRVKSPDSIKFAAIPSHETIQYNDVEVFN